MLTFTDFSFTLSLQIIIIPAKTITITHGKSWFQGASLKKKQPRINDDGIPKYSNEAILLAEIKR